MRGQPVTRSAARRVRWSPESTKPCLSCRWPPSAARQSPPLLGVSSRGPRPSGRGRTPPNRPLCATRQPAAVRVECRRVDVLGDQRAGLSMRWSSTFLDQGPDQPPIQALSHCQRAGCSTGRRLLPVPRKWLIRAAHSSAKCALARKSQPHCRAIAPTTCDSQRTSAANGPSDLTSDQVLSWSEWPARPGAAGAARPRLAPFLWKLIP